MKRIIALLVLTFILGMLMIGCTPTVDPDNQDLPTNNENSSDDNENPPENNNNEENKPDDNINPPANPDQGDEPIDPPANPDKGEEPTVPPVEEPEIEVGNKVGNLIKSVDIETLDGGSVNPTDYRGKIVIINVWATWCPPCKEELPDFSRIASEYSGDLVIIAAHDYYMKNTAPDYVNTNLPESNIIFGYDTSYGDVFYAIGGTEYIPMTAIIDRDGVIVYSDSGMLTYNQLVSIIENIK